MSYTNLATKLKAKIAAVTYGDAGQTIPIVESYPEASFESYPAATVFESETPSRSETNNENERTYTYVVRIFQETKILGKEAAYDRMRKIVDKVINAFDTDFTLTGLSLGTGYDFLIINPVPGTWLYWDDEQILMAEITLECRISVDLDTVN